MFQFNDSIRIFASDEVIATLKREMREQADREACEKALDEAKAAGDWGLYWDLYKDLYGVRPRWLVASPA